jgi:putative glycosyltransferase (TIGR04372 family)
MKLKSLRTWIFFPFVFPILLLMRIISPIILIRTGGTYGSRIGHFAENNEIYLCEKDHDLHPKRTFDIFFHPFRICNYQLKTMWDRHPDLKINQFAWFLHHGGKILPGSERYQINTTIRDAKDVLIKSKIHLKFTHKEQEDAQKELVNIGVPLESKFIGVISRDSSYLKNTLPTTNWSYHNYRDSNIENYLLSAEELSARGHSVIRMGVNVEKAFKSNDPQIIDYASKGYRTDLLDIYIAAKCHFFVSGNCGLDSVPIIFRRPVVLVNYVPIEFVRGWYKNSLTIFKKHWLIKEKRLMTFREIIESGAGKFYYAELFEQQGIELIENTPEEIRDVVIEMDERLNGTWETTEQDEELQRQFWALFKPNFKPHEGNPIFRCSAGTKFLQQNKDLLG